MQFDKVSRGRGEASTPLGGDSPSPQTKTAPPPVPTQAKTIFGLSEVVLNLVLSFVDSSSLVDCQAVCRLLGNAAQNDDLWQIKCLEDWGEDRPVHPENRSRSVGSFLTAWRGWRRAFNDYDASAVKRVASWWAGIEKWVSVNVPEVLLTLNTGVSEEDLNRAEEMLGWELPVYLRLLYRFHNGQWLPWDELLNESLGVDEGRPAKAPDILGGGISMGLLGGYCFYTTHITSKLFSLQRGVVAGLAAVNASTGENRGYFEANAARWETDLEAVRKRGGFMIAASHDTAKRTWVGKDGNVRFDGRLGTLMGVFDAAPVDTSDPPLAAQNADGRESGNPPKGNLMNWLEEYLRRLERGHFGVRPSSTNGNMLGARQGMACVRGIWLFPQEGGEGCVTEVTNGVEIRVSPVFVPEACPDPKELMWSYSLRMRLLRDHPSRPQGLSACQLTGRRWEINGTDGYHREVTGSGVVGEFPVLTAVANDYAPSMSILDPRAGHFALSGRLKTFEYESCTVLDKSPGTMSGHLSFEPGSISAPSGPSFDVRVPPFDLVNPDFIF